MKFYSLKCEKGGWDPHKMGRNLKNGGGEGRGGERPLTCAGAHSFAGQPPPLLLSSCGGYNVHINKIN